jgi:uncharacterized protein
VTLAQRYPSLPYVLPFAVFLFFLAIQDYTAVLGRWEFPLRIIVLSLVLLTVSRPVLDLRVRHLFGSIALGVAVFVIWIGPDVLIPGYRQHWLFQNSIMGTIKSSIDPALRQDSLVLLIRSLRAIILVPIIEELFWRAWLMRWLINQDFQSVKLGAYTASSFWLTALLFASEHGPYWEVGLLAGIAYNWWMIRTRSLGDCIVAHAVTNALLCLYVIQTQKWEYWM